ncbi:hypothetical protein AB0C97_26830 [Streptomyces goshikiensis]|uniref:hypothetical protein n=1 Tax=Streptomyces goshikiensis TaxID=1942 RepID=UPI0033FB3AC0
MDVLSAIADIAGLIAAIATITLEILRARTTARTRPDTDTPGDQSGGGATESD